MSSRPAFLARRTLVKRRRSTAIVATVAKAIVTPFTAHGVAYPEPVIALRIVISWSAWCGVGNGYAVAKNQWYEKQSEMELLVDVARRTASSTRSVSIISSTVALWFSSG